MSDFIIGGIVLPAVLLIVVKSVRNYKKGGFGCGCDHCICEDHKSE